MIKTFIKYSNSYDLERNIIIKPYELIQYINFSRNRNENTDRLFTYIKCYISNVQMKKPSRGRNCEHLECCEFNIFIMYTLLKQQCIICGKSTQTKDVMIDTYLKKIFDIAISQIKSTSDNAFYISISKIVADNFKWEFCDYLRLNDYFSVNSDKMLYSFFNCNVPILNSKESSFSIIDNYLEKNLEKDFEINGIKCDLINSKEPLKNFLQKGKINEIAFVIIYVFEKDLKSFLQKRHFEERYIYIILCETEDLNNLLDLIKQTNEAFNVNLPKNREFIPITKKLYSFEPNRINFILHHFQDEEYIDVTKRFIYEYINFLKNHSF